MDTGGFALRPTPEEAYAQQVPYVREDDEGRRYPVFGHVFPLMTLPFYAAGRWLAPAAGFEVRELSLFTFSFTNTLISALGVWLWCLVAARIGAGRRTVGRFAVWMVFATPILFYAVSQWREPGILMLLGGATLAFLDFTDEPERRTRALAFGAWLGLLWLFKEGNAILVACLYVGALLRVWTRSRRLPVGPGFWLGLPIAVGLILHGVVMGVRFGMPFSTFYEPGLQITEGDPWARLGRILWSPEVGGLAIYAAPVVLGVLVFGAVRRRRPYLAASLVVASLLFLWLHATIRNGEGGKDVWGPRHLIPLFPLFLLALALWWQGAGRWPRVVAAGVLVVSSAVQLLPIVQPYNLYPDMKKAAPSAVAKAMPTRLVGSAIVAGHVVAGRGPKFEGGPFGVDPDQTWDHSGDRVVAGGVNIWWLRGDVPRVAPLAGGMLLLLAVLAWWFVLRRVRTS